MDLLLKAVHGVGWVSCDPEQMERGGKLVRLVGGPAPAAVLQDLL